MRKTIMCALALLAMMAPKMSMAQPDPSAAAVVYYMPYTTLVAEIDYEETTLTAGPFYQYAERYLGTKDVISESGKKYNIRSVQLHSKTTADQNRSYTFTPSVATVSHLRLTKEGILEGINLPAAEAPGKEKNKPTAKEKTAARTLTPYLEEQMLASSTAKMAESTAKQIYRLREARLNLAAGDVDKMPADGKSMELALKELREAEQALSELFVGKQETVIRKHIVTFQLPENAKDVKEIEEELLFRFSQYDGPVDADDLSGKPYYITLRLVDAPEAPAPAKKPVAASPICYNVPGSVEVIITNGEEVMDQKIVTIAQYGYSVPLPLELVKAGAVVRLDTRTGALLSIE